MDSTFRAERDLGYGQLTCDASTLLSTITVNGVVGIPAGASLALIQPETQAIRVRSDGTAPTTTVGYPVAVGAELKFTAGQFPNARLIAQTAGAVVNVWFFG